MIENATFENLIFTPFNNTEEKGGMGLVNNM